MSWPEGNDYRDALQHPARAFSIPELQKCQAETNALGVPKARSGNFAIVYKLVCGSQAVAVRVFKYPNPHREKRFQAIHEHLDRVRPRMKTGCLLDFRYFPRGIRVGPAWYPVQTMEWVKGETLGEWLKHRVARRDTQAVAHLAERWIAMMDELRGHEVAHGDLQHGNVMVVNGELRLVDYDCMCVPRLKGEDALEEGMPGYQHPSRPGRKLSPDLDHFSAWIILISLRAVAAEPRLYEDYIVRTNSESLLFVEEDIRKPDSSRLWQELLSHRDSKVAEWSRRLRACLPAQPWDRIPVFEVDPFARLREACRATPRDWGLIVREAADPQLQGRAFPADLAGTVREALERDQARQLLERAVGSGNPREVVRAYAPQLVDDWAACAPLVRQARHALSQVQALDQLQDERRQPGNGRKLVLLWGRHAALLAGLGEAADLQRDAQTWQARIEAADLFLQAIRAGAEEAIARAWDAVVRAGGHPEADAQRARGELARKRADCLRRLRAVPAAETEDNDRQLVNAWDAGLLHGCAEADPLRAPYQAARTRLQQLEAFEDRLHEVDRTKGDESVLLTARGLPTPSYCPRLQPRISQSRTRVALINDLRQALQKLPVSDRAVADAWDRAQAAGARVTDAAIVQRCQEAVARRACLRRLEAISTRLPADEQDQQWLKLWDEGLLQGCADAAPLQPRHELARTRTRLWEQVQAALQARDPELRSLIRAPVLVGYPPLQKVFARIADFLAWLDGVGRLEELCKADQPDWQEVLRIGTSLRAAGKSLPAEIEAKVEAARRRCEARDRLTQAVASHSLRQIQAAYAPDLLDDWKACVLLVTQARQAGEHLRLVEQLEQERARTHDGRRLVDLWAQHAADLRGFLEAGPLEKVAAQWRDRLDRLGALEQAVGKDDSEQAIVSAREALHQAGDHPDAARHEDRVEMARKRAPLLERLRAVLGGESEDTDRQLDQLWDEGLLGGSREAQGLRPALEAARGRLQSLEDLAALIPGVDQRRLGEDELLRAAGALPNGYRHHLQPRVQLARERVEARRQLDRVKAGAAPSDRDIARAWEHLRACGGAEIDQEERERCLCAVRRRDCLGRLEAVAASLPLDEQDRQWLALWDEALLQGCVDADPLRARHETARRRLEAWRHLEEVLRLRDVGRIEQAAGGPLPGDYPPLRQRQPEVDALLHLARHLRTLGDACGARPRDWEAIDRLARDPCLAGRDLPPVLEGIAREAAARVEARTRLEDAIRLDRLQAIAEAYEPDRIDDWKGCEGLAELGRRARELAPVLDELTALVRAPGDGRTLVGRWDQVAARFQGITEAQAIEAEARRWATRIQASETFQKALREERREQAIAEAWRRLEQVGGHPDSDDLVERARLAQRRAACLRQLEAIPAGPDSDEQDRLWLKLWDGPLLEGCREGDAFEPRHRLARERLEAWGQLEEALQARDLLRVARLASQPLLDGYPPCVARRAEIEKLKDQGVRFCRIVERIQAGDPGSFNDAEDRACLASSQTHFERYSGLIAAPTCVWKIDQVRLGPGDPPLARDEDTGMVTVRWLWRPAQGVSYCWLATSETQHFQLPADARNRRKVTEDEYRRNLSKIYVVVPEDFGQLYVTIWPVIDLGWISLAGEPLTLGPLAVRDTVKPARRGWFWR